MVFVDRCRLASHGLGWEARGCVTKSLVSLCTASSHPSGGVENRIQGARCWYVLRISDDRTFELAAPVFVFSFQPCVMPVVLPTGDAEPPPIPTVLFFVVPQFPK